MSPSFEMPEVTDINDRLRDATSATASLLTDLISTTCHGFSSIGTAKTGRIAELMRSCAWTDAALTLIDLELPTWQVRRIAYDDGEWFCALSRQRELPDWLDRSVEARHSNLALAILSAFVEARQISARSSQASVPAVVPHGDALYERVNTDHFG